MNIVSGVNPKTGKKEIYKFADTDKGFQNAQDELDKMNKLKFKEQSMNGNLVVLWCKKFGRYNVRKIYRYECEFRNYSQ